MFNGRRQPSRGGTSRMTRECQVRFCERLGVKFPGPTRRRKVVDAGDAQPHQAMRVELPILVTVAAEPVAAVSKSFGKVLPNGNSAG
jgi:hypothetical protein